MTRGEWAGLAGCAAAFLLLRLPLLMEPGVRLGWNSDAAIYGLMARAMVSGREFPLFFWGQDYLGTLTSMTAAVIGMLFFGGQVSPLVLRLAASFQIAVACLFFWAGLRRIVGRGPALLMLFWLAAGPSFLLAMSYAPLSAEQMFVVGSIVFWLVVRSRFMHAWQWLALGLLAGLGWWAHRGVVFILLPALAVIVLYDRSSIRARHLVAAAIGAAAGSVPAFLGHASIAQRLYTPLHPPWGAGFVLTRIVETLTSDLWQLLGGLTAGSAVLLLLVLALRHPTVRSRETVFTAGVLAACAAFWALSTQAHPGAVRYLVFCVPIVYAFAARGVMAAQRAAGVLLALVVTTGLYAGRFNEVRAIAAGRGEQHDHRPGGFDPRPALRAIDGGGYTACYADFWLAYKLEWLSDRGVPFIPYRSVNRTMRRSLQLAGAPGPKCFVDLHGNVRRLTPEEERAFQRDTERLVRGRRD